MLLLLDYVDGVSIEIFYVYVEADPLIAVSNFECKLILEYVAQCSTVCFKEEVRDANGNYAALFVA